MNLLDRYRGAMLGLAAGDALGTTLEFSPPGSFEPITDMVGGGPFGLEPGQWTDDTSMALCLAESLIESGEFDAVDQLARYVRWKRHGHHSSNGRCFDIGSTVMQALAKFERTSDPCSAARQRIGPATDRSCAWHRYRCSSPTSPKLPLRGALTARGPRTVRQRRLMLAVTSAG